MSYKLIELTPLTEEERAWAHELVDMIEKAKWYTWSDEPATDNGTVDVVNHGGVGSFEAGWRLIKKDVACECGGDAANTTHSDWCPKFEKQDK